MCLSSTAPLLLQHWKFWLISEIRSKIRFKIKHSIRHLRVIQQTIMISARLQWVVGCWRPRAGWRETALLGSVEPCWGLRRDWGPKLTSCRATTGGLARKPYQGGICIANINWLSDQRLNFCAWYSKFDMVHFFSLTCNKIGVCPSWFSKIDGVHFLARFYDLRQN